MAFAWFVWPFFRPSIKAATRSQVKIDVSLQLRKRAEPFGWVGGARCDSSQQPRVKLVVVRKPREGQANEYRSDNTPGQFDVGRPGTERNTCARCLQYHSDAIDEDFGKDGEDKSLNGSFKLRWSGMGCQAVKNPRCNEPGQEFEDCLCDFKFRQVHQFRLFAYIQSASHPVRLTSGVGALHAATGVPQVGNCCWGGCRYENPRKNTGRAFESQAVRFLREQVQLSCIRIFVAGCGGRQPNAEFTGRSVPGLTVYRRNDETVLTSKLSDGLCQNRWQRAAHLHNHCQKAGGKWSGLYVIRPAVMRLAVIRPAVMRLAVMRLAELSLCDSGL